MVDGDALVYIHKQEGTLAVKVSAQLGARRPLHRTVLGEAYLAALPGQELEARLTGLELTRFTGQHHHRPGSSRWLPSASPAGPPAAATGGWAGWSRPPAAVNSRRLGHG